MTMGREASGGTANQDSVLGLEFLGTRTLREEKINLLLAMSPLAPPSQSRSRSGQTEVDLLGLPSVTAIRSVRGPLTLPLL